MKFPYIVCELTNEEENIFEEHYLEGKSAFNIEGLWRRSQSEKNKNSSHWRDKNDNRRRIIYYSDNYEILRKGDNIYLCIASSCIYLSVRLLVNEMNDYMNRIYNELSNQGYYKKDGSYIKDDIVVTIKEYKDHPIDIKNNTAHDGYVSTDIEIRSDNYQDKSYYDRIWNIWEIGIRDRNKRGNPQYINKISEIKDLFPAQIEMGCGPSIEAGIPPLHYMHEVYKVQRHEDGTFYFGKEDSFVVDLLKNTHEKYEEFSNMIRKAIKADITDFYKTVAKMYEQELFVGTLFNNNFDRLIQRLGINELLLRVYVPENYHPTIEFDPKAKSLICIGTHADRRGIQQQAREKGLKIIYVDPEAFLAEDGIEKYPIEGAQNEDIILQMTAGQFAKLLKEEFLL